jgi:uncharacterized protein involved in tolerance to divalent cations
LVTVLCCNFQAGVKSVFQWKEIALQENKTIFLYYVYPFF